MTHLRLSVLALIAANLVPLAGVLFWQWDIFSIIFLYWLESGVIGFYHVLKMIIISKWLSLLFVPFLMAHYGGFMFVHLVFILFFFQPEHGAALNQSSTAFDEALANALWPAAALLVSHGVSFFTNFIGKKEYANMPTRGSWAAPYKRIIIMHLTLFLGAFAMATFGTLTLGLALLVCLKTIADIYAHVREHTRPTRQSIGPMVGLNYQG